MKLSICCITYNHEKFIAQALEGFVNQKTNFDFEIVVADDYSTDNTRKICLEYQNKYPDKIRLLLNQANIGSMANFLKALKACKSKYIALCDGDDYWCDENKLQKQVDFLETNLDYVLCFTRGIIHNTFYQTKQVNLDFETGKELTIRHFINGNDQLTATAVIRNKSQHGLPDYFSQSPFGDVLLYLWLMFGNNSKAFCLPDVTAVYRIHGGGVHGHHHESKEKLIKAYKMHLVFYELLKNNLFQNEYKKELNEAVIKTVSIITRLCRDEKKFFKGTMLNVRYMFKGISFKVFASNTFKLQKQYIKSLIG